MDAQSRRLTGTPAAPGLAIGPAWIWRPDAGPSTGAPATGLDEAAQRAADQLFDLADRLRALGRPEDAEILEAQALMATDETLLGPARTAIEAGTPRTEAITKAAEDVARTLAALDDETLSARAADVRDVGARIARVMVGRALELPAQPSIAVAADLPPSVTAEIPSGLLLGIALAGSTPTSHAAILARGLAIPAVVRVDGLDGLIGAPERSSIVALDGYGGAVVVDPTEVEVASLRSMAQQAAAAGEAARALRGQPGRTADGRRVPLLANIGRPEDAGRAIDHGAEGVGLLRTEFLFLGRLRPPDEDEQVAAYRRVFEAFGPDRPVVVRLADIGGDKEVAYLGLPAEANPFLGVRAIRLARSNPDLLVTQLRAVHRAGAAAGVTPHVMAPMVATVGDVELLRALEADARSQVLAAGQAIVEDMPIGIMVEVPSAVFLAPELTRLVDFVSIGTNDLTQYLLAADRTNGALADYSDASQPAVLRAIGRVVEAADDAGIPVAVCGELAGDPEGARILVGLGVDELSMDASSLDTVRQALATSTVAELESLALAALATSG